MRTELLLLTASACAAPSMSADLDRIRELSRLPLPDVTTSIDEAGVDDEVQKLLAAPLSADGAVKVALLNNRELRATLRGLGVAHGRLVQAGTLPNPTFEFDLRQSGSEIFPLQKDFFVEYEITEALLTGYAQDAASADLEAARFVAAAETLDLGFRTRRAFFALQAAEQRFAVTQRVLDAQAASRDAARALAKAGNITELALATHEVAYEDARATAAELELEVQERREDLQDLMGLFGERAAWKTAETLAPVPASLALPADLEPRAITASLLLAETKSRLEAIAHRTGLAQAQGWLPDIAVDMHAEQDEDRWEIGGGATIGVPIFDRHQGALAAHEAEFDALHERYVGQAVTVRSQARRTANRLASAHARAKQFQEVIVPARARVMQHTLLQYNAMQLGVFELLEARRAELIAELSHIDALRDFWTAQAALDAILAGRLVDAPMASRGFGEVTTTGGH